MADQAPIDSQSALLLLPEPCLLAVLTCCADDLHSFFSAARAHSKLHDAAVLVLRSITVDVNQQQQADSMLKYLSSHGQHVHSVKIKGAKGKGTKGNAITLRQFPASLQLSSLQLEGMRLQLQPVGGLGVLGPTLKQLRLTSCKLLGDNGTMAAVLSQLLGLEHLDIGLSYRYSNQYGMKVCIPTNVLQQMQQLTHLMLDEAHLVPVNHVPIHGQQIQALTRLVHLHIATRALGQNSIPASMLLGACQMTRLQLRNCEFEGDVLADKSQLQHLDLQSCGMIDPTEGQAKVQLLSHIQQLQQLTHLGLAGSLDVIEGGNIPAAAVSALTTSSKLQHLNISNCMLPQGVWQHLFPTGRQLQHLTSLSLTQARIRLFEDDVFSLRGMASPEGSRLVSCCPGLRVLDMQDLRHCAERLAQLNGLSGLQTLRLSTYYGYDRGLEAVSQLTGLLELTLRLPKIAEGFEIAEGLLPTLTHLQQLTNLDYSGPIPGVRYTNLCLSAQELGDEPVWRQLLKMHNSHD